MSASILRRAACAAILSVGLASGALAQTYANPNLPRSPYALPQPVDRPDVEDLLEGNGRLHASGQWRHWGDSRNTGEFVQQLIAPSGVLDVGPGSAGTLPGRRFCAYHPDQC